LYREGSGGYKKRRYYAALGKNPSNGQLNGFVKGAKRSVLMVIGVDTDG
jgi:hypothetical protein